MRNTLSRARLLADVYCRVCRTRLKELPPDANPLAFGNEVYRIVFDDRSKFPAFGHRYTFYLTDAVEDVPEYVVQWQAFEE